MHCKPACLRCELLVSGLITAVARLQASSSMQWTSHACMVGLGYLMSIGSCLSYSTVVNKENIINFALFSVISGLIYWSNIFLILTCKNGGSNMHYMFSYGVSWNACWYVQKIQKYSHCLKEKYLTLANLGRVSPVLKYQAKPLFNISSWRI
jgi:hypothetical protein